MWGADLPPTGPLYREDSRFVLVHHTASPNDGRDPREPIRISHAYHTGPKAWPDVAYNFMIGHDGSVWETRAGSLAGPIVADASGGRVGATASRRGTPMSVRTVSGHRDCTFTTCPGDVGYSLIPQWQAGARAVLAEPPERFAHADRLGEPGG